MPPEKSWQDLGKSSPPAKKGRQDRDEDMPEAEDKEKAKGSKGKDHKKTKNKGKGRGRGSNSEETQKFNQDLEETRCSSWRCWLKRWPCWCKGTTGNSAISWPSRNSEKKE